MRCGKTGIGAFGIGLMLSCVVLHAQAAGSDAAYDIKPAEISVISRNGGCFDKDNHIFYAGQEAWYEVGIEKNSTVSGGVLPDSVSGRISYQIGNGKYEAEIVDGAAKILIPKGQSGELEIAYGDVPEKQIVEKMEYIISESSSPAMDSKTENTAEGIRVHLTMEETGEVISGIKMYQCTLDGKTIEAKEEETDMHELPNGVSVRKKAGIVISVEDQEEHELTVIAEDNCGNIAEKTVEIGGKAEVVSVLLPSEFSIIMYEEPDSKEVKIESQDILMINTGEQPVNVKVSKVEFTADGKTIDGEGRKLSVKIMEYGKQDAFMEMGEDGGIDPFTVSLSESRSNARELMQEASGWNPIGSVGASDYSILRLSGELGEGNWSADDIKVNIVFEFEKVSG